MEGANLQKQETLGKYCRVGRSTIIQAENLDLPATVRLSCLLQRLLYREIDISNHIRIAQIRAYIDVMEKTG